MNNYEKIKAMSIEELASFLDSLQDDERDDHISIGCNRCCNYNTHHYPDDCKERDGSVCVDMGGAIAWLKRDTLQTNKTTIRKDMI